MTQACIHFMAASIISRRFRVYRVITLLFPDNDTKEADAYLAGFEIGIWNKCSSFALLAVGAVRRGMAVELVQDLQTSLNSL